MSASRDPFQRSIDEQIAINQARTPSERFKALYDLLDSARAMAPRGPEAQEQRRRATAARELDREQWRERCRQIIAAQRADAGTDA
jgi:hypothetical protein